MSEYSREIKKVLRWSLVLIFILAFFLVVLSVNALKEYGYIGQGVYPTQTVTMTGKGEVFGTPDVAQFTFTITEEADSIAAAQDMVSEKIATALEALEGHGVEEKDISTTGYNAYPRYAYPEIACVRGACPPQERVLQGYEVSQTTSVKVRNTEEVGNVLQSVADAGISNVGGIQFVIDDQDALIEEARAEAIAEAKEKVDSLARELGVRVKGVVGFSENFGGEPMPYARAESSAMGYGGDGASAPKLSPGESEVRVMVYVTYEIK